MKIEFDAKDLEIAKEDVKKVDNDKLYKLLFKKTFDNLSSHFKTDCFSLMILWDAIEYTLDTLLELKVIDEEKREMLSSINDITIGEALIKAGKKRQRNLGVGLC
nr:hypothetical protein [Clostridioides sp.]